MCFLSYFNFERNYDVLKSKSSCILLNQNFNFNKNETESKMENPTQRFKRERKLVLQLIQEPQIKKNCDKRKLAEETRGHFWTIYFVRRTFFLHLCFISMYSLLNTLSEYTYIYTSKTITSYIFCLFLKSSNTLTVSLRYFFFFFFFL